MKLLDERPEDILADIHLISLRIVYPEFWFALERRRTSRSRWVAVRRDVLTAGLHTVVTGNLDELLAVLGPPDLSYKPVIFALAEVAAEGMEN